MSENPFGNRKPSVPYTIQHANWRDLNELRALEKICFPIDQWSLLDMIAVLSMRRVVRLKATYQEKMIGFIAGEIKARENTAWIATLAVLPDYRRQGIASALLEKCEDELQQPVVRLCVRYNNISAIRLYAQHGYHTIDRWHHYYIDGADAIVLEKKRGE